MSDVLERLRVANPVPECPPPPIDGVWERLENPRATQHRPGQAVATAEGWERRWLSRVGSIVGVVGIVAAAVVAGGLVVLLGRERSARPPTASAIPRPLARMQAQSGQLVGGEPALAARVHSLHGMPLVVTIWASWCSPCRTDLESVNSVASSKGSQIGFLGVDGNDATRTARAFLAHHTTAFPSYRADLAALGRALPGVGTLDGLPTTIYINRAGRVVNIHAGEYGSSTALERDIATYLQPRKRQAGDPAKTPGSTT